MSKSETRHSNSVVVHVSQASNLPIESLSAFVPLREICSPFYCTNAKHAKSSFFLGVLCPSRPQGVSQFERSNQGFARDSIASDFGFSLRYRCLSLSESARRRSAYCFATVLSPRASWKLANASRVLRSLGWSTRDFSSLAIAASALPVECSATA